ncbi:MAG: nucleotidyltransferase family protein [Pseudomonadota bacterium]
MPWRKPQIPRVRALAFRPPPLVLDAELQWLLQRAFGPLTWKPTKPISGERLVNIALRLDVAARIAARQPRELVEREMGLGPAHRLREQYVGTVARGAMLDHALSELLDCARASDVSCILLKYAALNRMGVLRVGSRVASDVDVLVPHTGARRFQAILEEKGYQDSGSPESSHQLPALLDRNGVLVELHVHIPLVTLAPGQPFARADDLLAAGLTIDSTNALIPDAAIVAAHAIAHGLMQHAQVPHVYSPLKTFADLADLQLTRPNIVEQARTYLSRTMTAEDLMSVQTLARALPLGDLETAMTGGAGILLRHALASQLDRHYAIRLRLGALTQRRGTSVRRNPAQLFRSLRAAWNWARSDPNRQR